MTDSRLRELERKWKESGSTEDEAAYLLERVRCGDLEKEKLELAASLGHSASCRATGIAEIPARNIDEIQRIANEFSHSPAVVRVRAGFAATLSMISAIQGESGLLPNSLVDRLFREVATWIMSPSHSNATAAETTGQGVLNSLGHAAPWRALRDLGKTPRNRSYRGGPDAFTGCLSYCFEAAGNRSIDAIREELVPWLLGYGDPVQERYGPNDDR